MLIFDQLQKADRHLRVLSWLIALGMLVLLGGLWWVQVVRSRHYVENERLQSYRTVRVPAPRGKILDRNGVALAENRPVYSVSIYLADRAWRDRVHQEYARAEAAARAATTAARPPSLLERVSSWFGYQPSLVQHRRLTKEERERLEREARYSVTSNIVMQLGAILGQSIPPPDEAKFRRHYEQSRVMPFPILSKLDAAQIARLQERGLSLPGVDMEIQPQRIYPHHTLAAQVIGCLRRTEESADGELSTYDYKLPDYRGYSGIEASLDEPLRGHAGAKSVLVNNLGYRQNETDLSSVEVGRDVTLTLDTNIQTVAERELGRALGYNQLVRGAAVVLDVRTGEILAMASAPVFNPNDWIPLLPQTIWNTYTNEDVAPLQNRAVFGNYRPGSTFKIFVALAGLEAGTLDTNKIIRVDPNPHDPAHGGLKVGSHFFKDTAAPGDYRFRLAFIKSSNSYFVQQGLLAGAERIVGVAQQFHFGERTGVPLQESPGLLPTSDWMRRNQRGWSPIAIGNISIGQGDVDVTPLQLAVAIAAVANGGRVLTPQLVLQTSDPEELATPNQRPTVRPILREQVRVSTPSLDIVRQAMLADVEDRDGSGNAAFVRDYRVCGKTGTAQVEKGGKFDHYTVWFASYAPFENPRYAVVVMVDGEMAGVSGGHTCAPVAGKIYQALKARDERLANPRRDALAGNFGQN